MIIIITITTLITFDLSPVVGVLVPPSPSLEFVSRLAPTRGGRGEAASHREDRKLNCQGIEKSGQLTLTLASTGNIDRLGPSQSALS